MKSKNTNVIDYGVIVKATDGDPISINQILDKYEPYINRLATIEMYDTHGNKHTCINDEFKRILQTKLITAILKFKPV